MKRLAFKLILISLILISCNEEEKNAYQKDADQLQIDWMGIGVNATENREYSFTDKKSGYWYAKTATQYNNGYFDGWTVFRNHIFSDYKLYVDGEEQIRKDAVVYPYKISRRYEKVEENFYMFDNIEALLITVDTLKKTDKISLQLLGDDISFLGFDKKTKVAYYKPVNYKGKILALASLNPDADFNISNKSLELSPKSENGFFIILGDGKKEVLVLRDELRKNYEDFLKSRKYRMSEIVEISLPIQSNMEDFDRGMNWVSLTLDQLVTRQMGHGIYAGLPWFNDYWGRDMFITLPGSNLVSGQFDIARKILKSFVEFQNTDEKSKYYGRIPNRARPDEVIYNTTDGTPRFVNQILEFVKYSGDTSLIRELYPAVQKSIIGSMKYWMDENAYLTHDDADTWMDAKRNGFAFSPRGNRANDIQALWYKQLKAGEYFANFMGDSQFEDMCSQLSLKLRSNFEKDFFDSKYKYMADRIELNGEKDFKMRPNQLFALDLVDDEVKRLNVVKEAWKRLVYPWGVASLDQNDDYFHPYHHWDDYYFFDEAYHNGTVWVWNNGIAMERMLEFNQKDKAFSLFENMIEQANKTGAVGSIAENFDAIPREDGKFAEKTGTFLQAWSNAEMLRVWYQNFIGIKPDYINQQISIKPRIPSKFNYLELSEKFFKGKLLLKYISTDKYNEYFYVFEDLKAEVILDFERFKTVRLHVNPGDKIDIKEGSTLKVVLEKADGESEVHNYQTDEERLYKIKTYNNKFNGVEFVKPKLNENSYIFRRKKAGKFNIEIDKIYDL